MGRGAVRKPLVPVRGRWRPESGRTEPGTETLESRTFPYETVETETETEETPPETEYDPGEPVAREKIETNLMIASDIHYMSPSLTDYGKAYQTMADNGDGKVIQYMPQIWEAFASKVKEARPDALILSGDLTLDGGKSKSSGICRQASGAGGGGRPGACDPRGTMISITITPARISAMSELMWNP